MQIKCQKPILFILTLGQESQMPLLKTSIFFSTRNFCIIMYLGPLLFHRFHLPSDFENNWCKISMKINLLIIATNLNCYNYFHRILLRIIPSNMVLTIPNHFDLMTRVTLQTGNKNTIQRAIFLAKYVFCTYEYTRMSGENV